ncbi:hypothetical protein OV090_45030 [Nannocystis sp. RBIL2]|nr:hypothetical protein [Nannocystis sp. RBIL2]MCY1071993.1 hypothetical protein [Nannocystis sp. RBIL2]
MSLRPPPRPPAHRPAAEDPSARLSLRLDGADACVEYSGTTGFSWRG